MPRISAIGYPNITSYKLLRFIKLHNLNPKYIQFLEHNLGLIYQKQYYWNFGAAKPNPALPEEPWNLVRHLGARREADGLDPWHASWGED